VAAVGLAACGGGSDSDSGGSADAKAQDAGIAFARCMRAHGVDVPDPQTSGGRVLVRVRADKNRPRFEAAQKACQKYMPEPGKGPGAGS
jgi:hypothetical protein